MRNLLSGTFVATGLASAILGWAAFAAATPAAAAKLNNCKDCLFGVTANGQKLGSRGVKSVERFGLGQYKVTFKKTVEGCALLATVVNLPNEGVTDAYISAVLTDDPEVVIYLVHTAGPDGREPVDATFTGALICL